MLKTTFLGWVCALSLSLANSTVSLPSTGANIPPVETIRSKDLELQKLLRDKEVSKKTDRIKVLISGIFDFEELGRHALGMTQWEKMTEPQRIRFVNAFRGMVENSSVKKLEAYSSDSTRYDEAETNADKSTVTAHVFSKGTESIVVYKLKIKQGAWKAWDLVIDDLSTAGNYGDQFKTILKKSTVDELIGKLEKKAQESSPAKATDNLKTKSEKTSKAAVKKTPGSGT